MVPRKIVSPHIMNQVKVIERKLRATNNAGERKDLRKEQEHLAKSIYVKDTRSTWVKELV